MEMAPVYPKAPSHQTPRTAGVDFWNITWKLPSGFADHFGELALSMAAPRIPVIFMAGGFETGKEVATLLPKAGQNVIVGYQYPLKVDPGHVPRAEDVVEALKVTSVQMAVALKWILGQSWCDPSRVQFVGVSLGTLFLPSALRIANRMGFVSQHTIFAYGGADVALLLDRELKSKKLLSDADEPKLLNLARALLLPLDPTTFLPFISGSFLVIKASNDGSFSGRESTNALCAALRSQRALCDSGFAHQCRQTGG